MASSCSASIFFKLRVLRLELLQPLGVVRGHRAEAPPPLVERLLAHAVLLRHLRDQCLVCLAEDPDHLLLGEPALAHRVSPSWAERTNFKPSCVHVSAGRPPPRRSRTRGR